MISFLTKRPFVFTAVFGCVSVLICYKYNLFTLIFSFALILILLLLFLKRKNLKFFLTIIFALLIVLSTFFTFIKISRLNALNGKPIATRLVAVETCENSGYYSTVTVKSLGGNLPKSTKLFLKYNTSKYISGGDIFSATIVLNGLDDSDYKDYYYGNSVYVGAEAINIVIEKEKSAFYLFTDKIRSYVKDTMLNFFDGDICGTLLALTTGDKSCLSDELNNNIKATGISHIIVVSGLHLAIIMSFIFKFTDSICINKFFKSAVSLFLVLLIIFVCGFSMSVIRAGIMYVVAALAPLLDQENDSLNSLGTAVTVVLIFTPFAVLNVSFQLSVLATLAIIWVTPFYYDLLIEKLNITFVVYKTVFNIVLGSVFATIFTLPVIINTFGYVSVIAPLTNLLVTYPVSWGLSFNIFGLVVNLLPLISSASWLIFAISGLCAKYIVFVVNSLANMPVTTVFLPKSSMIYSILLIVTIIAFILIYRYLLNKKGECQDGCYI